MDAVVVNRIEFRARRGNIGLVGAALLRAARESQPVPEARVSVSYERVALQVEAAQAMPCGLDADGVFDGELLARSAAELGIDLAFEDWKCKQMGLS